MPLIYTWLWIFISYSFLGWCVEVAYAALEEGRFSNRGFLHGPYCPIYGFGVLIVLMVLTPFQDTILVLFFGSMILATLLELLVGYVLKKMFHQRWWDYSDEPFNLGGYICLKFSILWGLACVFIVKILHPMIINLINAIPATVGWTLLIAVCLLILCDCLATVRTMLNLNVQLKLIDETASSLQRFSDGLGEGLSDGVIKVDAFADGIGEQAVEARGRLIEGKDQFDDKVAETRAALEARYLESLSILSKNQKRLLKVFPRAQSTRYNEQLQKLKERMNGKKR